MVADGVRTQRSDQPVKKPRSRALERRISVARPPYPIDDLYPGEKAIHHFADRADVILQVGINTDDSVALGAEEARQERILVTAIARQLDPYDVAVFRGKLL